MDEYIHREASLFYQSLCFIQVDLPHENELIKKMEKHYRVLEKNRSGIILKHFPYFCRDLRLNLKTRIRKSRIRSNSLKTRRISQEARDVVHRSI